MLVPKLRIPYPILLVLGGLVLDAERAAVVHLRNAGEISDEVARQITRDLDLEDARLEI